MEFDDPLFDVSTDKVDSEIPSPYDGVLLEILVPEGETAPVGTVLARIGEPGAATGSAPAGGPAPAAPAAPAVSAQASPTAAAAVAPAADRNGRMLSPLVRRLVAEAGLDINAIAGSGAGGRIRREDVERAMAAGSARAQAPTATAAPPPAAPAAPPHRRLPRHRLPPRPPPPRPPPPRPPRRDRPTRATRSCSSPACAWPWPRA